MKIKRVFHIRSFAFVRGILTPKFHESLIKYITSTVIDLLLITT